MTPSEVLWYPTSHTKKGGERNGAVPSHEFSGEVAEAGEGVKAFAVGQEIYGMNDWFAGGALAEYCVTRADWITPKPQRLSHVEAASVPIGALTAWQGLFDRGETPCGRAPPGAGRAAGAVGVFAIQFAHSRGVDVTAANAEFVNGLGANRVLDYTFEEEVRRYGRGI
jgi:NADPH:quinone reductase-like Zn-dependent oxidoreductase